MAAAKKSRQAKLCGATAVGVNSPFRIISGICSGNASAQAPKAKAPAVTIQGSQGFPNPSRCEFDNQTRPKPDATGEARHVAQKDKAVSRLGDGMKPFQNTHPQESDDHCLKGSVIGFVTSLKQHNGHRDGGKSPDSFHR
jgi:hypothetical protein